MNCMLDTVLDRLLARFKEGEGDEGFLSRFFDAPPVSFSEAFPNVPRPQDSLDPLLLAVRWKQHDLYGQDMPGVAADLLEAGWDTPSLRRLAGEMQVSRSEDIESLVATVFRELGVACPISEEDAELILARQVAREVIAGLRNPWQAESYLEIVVCGWHSKVPLIGQIFMLRDETSWGVGHRRSMEVITCELIQTFAELACIA